MQRKSPAENVRFILMWVVVDITENVSEDKLRIYACVLINCLLRQHAKCVVLVGERVLISLDQSLWLLYRYFPVVLFPSNVICNRISFIYLIIGLWFFIKIIITIITARIHYCALYHNALIFFATAVL